MKRPVAISSLAGLLACGAALPGCGSGPADSSPSATGAAGLSSSGRGALVARRPASQRPPAAARSGGAAQAPAFVPSGPVTFHGGPVLENPQVVLVYWGTNVAESAWLGAYYRDLLSNGYFDVVDEYSAVGHGSVIAEYDDDPGQDSAVKASGVVDVQDIANELSRLIGLGRIPQPNANTFYMVHFASSYQGVAFAAYKEAACSDCGGHTYFSSGAGNVVFGYSQANNCASNCVVGMTTDDATRSVTSHELAEAATNPTMNAWYADQQDDSGNPVQTEIADICAWQEGAAGGDSVQKLWSNTLSACVDQRPCGDIPGGTVIRAAGSVSSSPDGRVVSGGGTYSSCDLRFQLTMQPDGNLVLYQDGAALWAAGTSGSAATEADWQADGNLVLYDAGHNPIWASGTSGNPGSRLTVQDDGNVVIYGAGGAAIWATNTCCR